MELSVACPDLGFPDFWFTANPDSTAADVIAQAAHEWGVDGGALEVLFAGDQLSEKEKLASHGIEPDDEITITRKLIKTFRRSDFTDEQSRRQTRTYYHQTQETTLQLDTNSFVTDGKVIFDTSWMIPQFKHIVFCNQPQSLVIIGDYFLKGCSHITTLDLSVLTNVKAIGDVCLRGCDSLTDINLLGLTSTKSVGSFFLEGCISMSSIELSGLSNVTTIGDSFLRSCSSLRHISLSSISYVGVFSSFFLSSCCSLKSVDLSTMCDVTSIRNCFLFDCVLLETINLSGLQNLTTIRDNFLSQCYSITEIDFSSLTSLTSIGDAFLFDCSSVTNLNLSGFSSVTSIGKLFLGGCSSLASLDVSQFSSVTNVGNGFLSRCSSLQLQMSEGSITEEYFLDAVSLRKKLLQSQGVVQPSPNSRANQWIEKLRSKLRSNKKIKNN